LSVQHRENNKTNDTPLNEGNPEKSSKGFPISPINIILAMVIIGGAVGYWIYAKGKSKGKNKIKNNDDDYDDDDYDA
jgi:hypothetical protein